MRKRGYGLFILLLTGCASKPPEQPATSTGADTGVGTIVRLDPALDELVPPFGEDRETGWWIPVHRGTALVSGWLSLVQRCDRERRTAVESGWQGHRDLAARWRRKQRSAGGFVHRTKRDDCGRMARCCSASTATGRSLELPKIARFRCFSTASRANDSTKPPETPANCNWGDDGKSLYITARTGLYRIRLAAQGIKALY
jgi:hypothetical protein